MATVFNAGEVFEMGVQIERNGGAFYRQAAEQASDPQVKEVLRGLAEMEDRHEKLFARLRDSLPAAASPEIAYDPNGDVARYLRAAADTHVFNVYRDDPQALSELARPEHVLKAAIQFEKDSVVFFLGVREMVPEKLGRAEVESLIKEEMEHIATLTKQLEAPEPRP